MRTFAKTLFALAFFGGMTALQADTPKAAPADTSAVVKDKPMSVVDMRAQTETLRGGMLADHQHIIGLQAQARKLKDVIKLNCVNDKLVEANAQMNIADGANDALGPALEKGSDDRQGLFQTLSDAAASVKQLREGAAACIGTPELSKQESGVDFTSPEIPDDPTAPNSPSQFGTFEPPAYASPWH